MDKYNPRFLLLQKHEELIESFDFNCSLNNNWNVSGEKPNHVIELGQSVVLIYGDWINQSILKKDDFDFDQFMMDLKGHSVVILVELDRIRIACSHFSFLPVYYSKEKRIVANHWQSIIRFSSREIDELYLIESHLFNYPLGELTLYKDIKVLDSFSSLEICENEEFQFKTLVDIRHWFPIRVNDQIGLEELAEQFIASIQSYFTSEKELITFTSGFDGRTILASALSLKKEVHTFSMGRMENDDVFVPLSNAQDLKIPFEAIDLVSMKYQNGYLNAATRVAQLSGGRNGFLYPHFYYCSEYFKEFPVMHTGYCGSELFRALHIAGAVTSKEFVSIFLERDDAKLKQIVFQSNRLKYIQPEIVKRNERALWEKIEGIRSMRNQFNTTNHFFYYYIFKEAFRKIFGYWTAAQFENIKVRTPFLDISFILLLLQSDYAGCNNSFFTHNPLKRYKGQLLYAQIMKTLHSPLFKMMTGKNYRPNQLLSTIGQLTIVLPYLKKKWNRKKSVPNIDNLGLITGFQRSWSAIDITLDNVADLYLLDDLRINVKDMNAEMLEIERDMIFQIASLSLTLKGDEADCINEL